MDTVCSGGRRRSRLEHAGTRAGENISELLRLDPERIVTPGIFVDRVLHVPYGDPTGF